MLNNAKLITIINEILKVSYQVHLNTTTDITFEEYVQCINKIINEKGEKKK